ncbi:malic enzyme, NAD binding domain-containing protein [Ditylenchus destructor]|nr:malic enzyme, NAD binding domain-containing protein [Ditylenchus destructor]
MVDLGAKPANIFAADSKGLIQSERADAAKLDESKRRYCQVTSARKLADVIEGADVFLGCSTAGVLTADMVKTMADRPLILALANPEPEIRPEVAKAARPDCIMATGRSDYPNQVNNVLCFPYIFRGALDCGATTITEEMKLACVREIAELTKADISEEVATAYAGQELAFGPDYIIPKPFDPRLIVRIAPAVAKAAEESGVATRPIADMAAYREHLSRFVYQTGMFMRPVFCRRQGQSGPRDLREGEVSACCARCRSRWTRAGQAHADRPPRGHRDAPEARRPAHPAGRGRRRHRPRERPPLRQYWEAYHQAMGRSGFTPEMAKAAVRRSNTTIGALAIQLGDADAMICGMVGRFDSHLSTSRT